MEKQTTQLNKVARVTVFFWIMKILATTLGEVFGDFFSFSLNLGYLISLGITAAILIIVFVIQMKQVSFHAPIYWMVIYGTTTVGTEDVDLSTAPDKIKSTLKTQFGKYSAGGQIEKLILADRSIQSWWT